MTRDQRIFAQWFDNAHFGPRNDFVERDWQIECLNDYVPKVNAWASAHEGNGDVGQHRYTIYAGTGTGKTKTAALIAAWLLASGLIDQMVFVCPNRSIARKTRKDFHRFFGIDFMPFHKGKHANGVPRTKQGYILTYNHLMQDPTFHRRICAASPTLVIFDEVHHLGDESQWGESAMEAYGLVKYVVNLTGTPYRSDNRRIPFVEYEETETDGLVRFRADFQYRLGRAIVDGVCRKPIFQFHDGIVKVRTGDDEGYRVISFEDKNVDAFESSQRRRGAVKYGSPCRTEMLREALEICRAERRKVVIFLGGDTDGDQTPTADAREFLPAELAGLGYDPSEFDSVTGDDPEAQKKIEEIGACPTRWILIAINMVSEGTDIPEFSAAIFLTSITAKQTTVQRIGRVLRRMGEYDPHDTARIFMFRDLDYLALAGEIEAEIKHEVDLLKGRRAAEADGDPARAPSRHRAESIGVSGGHAVSVSAHGHEFPIEAVERSRAHLRALGLPATQTMAILKLLFEEGKHVV